MSLGELWFRYLEGFTTVLCFIFPVDSHVCPAIYNLLPSMTTFRVLPVISYPTELYCECVISTHTGVRVCTLSR